MPQSNAASSHVNACMHASTPQGMLYVCTHVHAYRFKQDTGIMQLLAMCHKYAPGRGGKKFLPRSEGRTS